MYYSNRLLFSKLFHERSEACSTHPSIQVKSPMFSRWLSKTYALKKISKTNCSVLAQKDALISTLFDEIKLLRVRVAVTEAELEDKRRVTHENRRATERAEDRLDKSRKEVCNLSKYVSALEIKVQVLENEKKKMGTTLTRLEESLSNKKNELEVAVTRARRLENEANDAEYRTEQITIALEKALQEINKGSCVHEKRSHQLSHPVLSKLSTEESVESANKQNSKIRRNGNCSTSPTGNHHGEGNGLDISRKLSAWFGKSKNVTRSGGFNKKAQANDGRCSGKKKWKRAISKTESGDNEK